MGGGCQVPLMSLGLLLPGPDDDGGSNAASRTMD